MNRLLLGVAITASVIWAFDTSRPAEIEQTSPTVPVRTVVLARPQDTAPPPTPIPTVSDAPTTTQAPTTTIPTLVGPDTPCQEWVPLALEVGWAADREVIEKLLTVMWRESRCQPDADSGPDHGLMQINQIHKVWLVDFGWTHEDMKDPRKNLTFALALWQSSGWRPWRFSGGA